MHISADGVPVLSHERTYAGRIVPLLTYAELAGLHPAGLEPIATLADLCDLLARARAPTRSGSTSRPSSTCCTRTRARPAERFVESVLEVLRAPPAW